MSWVETESPNFAARHDSADDEDVVGVLELLEATRAQLAGPFGAPPPGPISVVVHASVAGLYVAQPHLPVVVRLTAPAARRYVTGWAGTATLHLLAPRLLAARASNVPGSREMALLAPAALYAQLVVGAGSPRLPPPLRLRAALALTRWGWLAAGAAQWLSGQTAHARPAIARRLREGGRPAFPPGPRDAVLLGGTVVDLLAGEQGTDAIVGLIRRPARGGPLRALEAAFGGTPADVLEPAWRAHLTRLAGQAE